jgi:hypothetical protein
MVACDSGLLLGADVFSFVHPGPVAAKCYSIPVAT